MSREAADAHPRHSRTGKAAALGDHRALGWRGVYERGPVVLSVL